MRLKIQIMSDLHIRYPGARGFPALARGVDLVAIAGDTCEGLARAIQAMRAAYPTTEIVTCPGNHEFYGGSYLEQLAEGRECARELGVHLVEDSVTNFGLLRIVGATLWTSYDLLGERLRDAAMRTAYDTMRDHRRIKWQRNPWKRFRPLEARMLHQRSRAFIEAELAHPHSGPTIVLTHMAPSVEHIAPKSRTEMISAAFASPLEPVIDRFQPHYWISGHTHFHVDFHRGRTRLISNPLGYADEDDTGFDPSCTIEVDA